MTPDALKKVIEALEGLANKRLIRGTLWDQDENCGCLVGSIAPIEVVETCGDSMVIGTGNPRWLFASLVAKRWAEEFGLLAEDIDYLQKMNDLLEELTPEERYLEVLRQLRDEQD